MNMSVNQWLWVVVVVFLIYEVVMHHRQEYSGKAEEEDCLLENMEVMLCQPGKQQDRRAHQHLDGNEGRLAALVDTSLG